MENNLPLFEQKIEKQLDYTFGESKGKCQTLLSEELRKTRKTEMFSGMGKGGYISICFPADIIMVIYPGFALHKSYILRNENLGG
jgi:hypothetical protein